MSEATAQALIPEPVVTGWPNPTLIMVIERFEVPAAKRKVAVKQASNYIIQHWKMTPTLWG